MPGVTGSVIWAFEGETLPIDVTVFNALGEPASDIATADLGLDRDWETTPSFHYTEK